MKKTILIPLLLFITKIQCQSQQAFKATATCGAKDTSCWPSFEIWDQLNQTVNGNLVSVEPAGKPCYSGTGYNQQACNEYKKGYLFDLHRESHIGAMQNTNWETCADEENCLLPNGILGTLSSFVSPTLLGTCSSGSLPHYALVAKDPNDIAAVIQFAQDYRIALNIKNTGHDYLGRSTSPDSITIWTHLLDKIEFHQDFQTCESKSQKAFTFGAGVNWFQAYHAAHQHNVTVIGGAQAGVGVAGGWLQGGGHSMLTPAFGLGVDQVLQFKVVLANGEHVVANACQHSDLFWALRGGGGGSFGVVTEVTVRTYPRVKVQFRHFNILTLPLPGAQRDLLIEYARHSQRWAKEGWGGYFYYYGYNRISFVLGNPLLSQQEADASFKPFVDFINSKPLTYIKKSVVEHEFNDFYDVFMKVLYENSEMVGFGARIASRLIPQSQFSTNQTIEALIDAFLEGTKHTQPLSYVLPTQILATTSLRVQDENRETSVQPIFRDSVWHVIYTTGWVKGVPGYIRKRHADAVHKAIDPIRKLTPGGGAYMNEADVLEPNWRQSFWGDENYAKLLKIKQVYDPNNVFHCWKCIGWDEKMIAEDKKYRCYKY